MKRFLLVVTLAIGLCLVVAGLAWADFGISNFRMSNEAGGAKQTKFPSGTKTVYVMFDYKDAKDMPIQVRVYDPHGQVIFQQTKTYNGAGSEPIKVQISDGVAFSDGDYVTNIFQRTELYLTESLEWTVGEPSSRPQAQETAVVIKLPQGQQPNQAAPVAANSTTRVGGSGTDWPVLGAGVLFVALIGLVVWAVRGFVGASR